MTRGKTKKTLWDMSPNLHGTNQNFDFKPFIRIPFKK